MRLGAAGCGGSWGQVRAMRMAMSSAGRARVASRVLQASVTDSWLVVVRVRARRAMPVLRSAAGSSMSPSVYRTRVLPGGGCRRVARQGASARPVPRGRPTGRSGKAVW